jgi:hypothetical protein
MKVSFIPLPEVDDAVYAPNEDGIFRACRRQRWGFVDGHGNVVVPFSFAEVANGFSGGLAAVNQKQFKATWGYVDRQGKLVIPHRLASAGAFREHRAVVAQERRGAWGWGHLDPSGGEAVPLRHHGASAFSGGLAGVRDQSYVAHFVRPNGERAFAFQSSANVGLEAFAFVNGFAAVCNDDYRWGFLGPDGVPICDFRYDKTWAFSEGLGAVAHRVGSTNDDHEDNLYAVGLVDVAGREVLKPRYGAIYPCKEGLARVDHEHPRECRRHRVGFVDREGHEVVPCEYDEAKDFSEGLAAVKRGKKWGYIDRKGETVIDFRYDSAGPFSGGVAEVGIYGGSVGSYGYIDTHGAEVVPREFTSAWTPHHGVALVEQGGGMGPGLQNLPGARYYLVVFGGEVAAAPEAAEALIRAAVEHARAVTDDRDAHAAWEALAGALAKLSSDEARREILDELGRTITHPLLLENLAVETAERRDDAATLRLLSRALQQCPDKHSLLLGMQAVHLRLGQKRKAAAIARRLAQRASAPPAEQGRRNPAEMQEKLDEMHRLVNEAYALFVDAQRITSLLDKTRRAAELERELLAYWLGLSLDGRSIPSRRGEISASGMYIAALRQGQRAGEAAAWFREITRDRGLLAQCLRDFQESGENTMNNGLSALLDTKVRADLDYGAELCDFLDQTLGTFVTPLLPLACAGIAAQRGELERGLDYVAQAVRNGAGKKIVSDGGTDVREMVRSDPDLAPLRQLGELERILRGGGKQGPAKKRRSRSS